MYDYIMNVLLDSSKYYCTDTSGLHTLCCKWRIIITEKSEMGMGSPAGSYMGINSRAYRMDMPSDPA